MLDKPRKNTNGTEGHGCVGCPYAADMKGFVPDRLNDEAPVFIVAQNPGPDEENGQRLLEWKYGQPVYESCDPQPMVGKTGYAMRREYFPVAALSDDKVSVGNALRCRINHQNKIPPLKSVELKTALEHCHNAHFRLPLKTEVIVAQGELGLFAMTQEGEKVGSKITNWRGWVLPYAPVGTALTTRAEVWTPNHNGPIPVLAVNHVAYMFRFPAAEWYARKDWAKIPKILRWQWPREPTPIITVPPTVLPRIFAFDTEFNRWTKELIRYSMCYRTLPMNVPKVHVVESFGPHQTQPVTLYPQPVVITHNAIADLNYFEDLFSLKWGEYDLEDTMYAHAVLWSGLDHDLETLGSLYSPINRWKHLEEINPVVYSGGDAEGTLFSWLALARELNIDKESAHVYETMQMPLIPIIRKAHVAGIRTNHPRSVALARELFDKSEELHTQAEALAGWPINLKSNDQTGLQLYETEEIQEWALPPKRRS